MKKVVLLIILVITFTACAPSQETIEKAVSETLQAIPTFTFQPTYTIPPSQTPKIVIETKIVMVTVTPTPTPEFTPTPSQTPTITNTPEPENKKNRQAGFYLIPSEMSPGVWRSSNKDTNSCYWSITTATGDIIDNHFGMGGGTMYIPQSAYQVQLEPECGFWEFIQ